MQYFESINLKNMKYENKVFNLENESDVEKIIELWDSFDGDYSNSDNKFKIIYFLEGKLYCKRRLVLAIIKDWIKAKNCESLEQLNFTFSQDLTKSKYPLLIDIQESISYQPQKLEKNYFIQDNEKIIINGREYLLFKKWENRNIRDFVNLAKQIGYQIKEIVVELNQDIYKEKYNINKNTLFANSHSAEAKAIRRINTPIDDNEWIIVDNIGEEIDFEKIKEEFYKSGYQSKISAKETSSS